MKKPLIVALDFPSSKHALSFIDKLEENKPFVKVGMELFFQEGPTIIEQLKKRECDIFLDLKCHDIPNTVKSAMRQLATLNVDIVNVHAAGGKAMMEAALEGLDAGTKAGMNKPTCIAVTQLTSTTEDVLHSELLISNSMDETITHYASLAKESGLDGVVCSAHEVPLIKETCGQSFLAITPGIRMLHDRKDDQHRIVTPRNASKLGSDAIVVGRSITKAKEPNKAFYEIKNAWEGME